MQKAVIFRQGSFTLRGLGQELKDGRFLATYVVTMRLDDPRKDIIVATGQIYRSQMEAANAALDLAIAWLGIHEIELMKQVKNHP